MKNERLIHRACLVASMRRENERLARRLRIAVRPATSPRWYGGLKPGRDFIWCVASMIAGMGVATAVWLLAKTFNFSF